MPFWGGKVGILKICHRVLKLWICLLRGWGRCLKLTLQTHAPGLPPNYPTLILIKHIQFLFLFTLGGLPFHMIMQPLLSHLATAAYGKENSLEDERSKAANFETLFIFKVWGTFFEKSKNANESKSTNCIPMKVFNFSWIIWKINLNYWLSLKERGQSSVRTNVRRGKCLDNECTNVRNMYF